MSTCGLCPDKGPLKVSLAKQCKCGSYYHASCFERAKKTADGSIVKCCGRKKVTKDDVLLDLDSDADNAVNNKQDACTSLDDLWMRIKHQAETDKKELMEEINNSSSLLVNRLDGLMERVDALESDFTVLDSRVLKLEEDVKDHSGEAAEQELIIAECKDRLWRERNVILFNVPEGSLDDDKAFIASALSDSHIVLSELKLIRIGLRADDKVRPLKVSCSAVDDAIWILRNSKKLFKNNCKCAPDRTPAQRNHLKAVLMELDSRKRKGEKNLLLRYQGGMPFIHQGHSAGRDSDGSLGNISNGASGSGSRVASGRSKN